MSKIQLERAWAMPSKDTFSIKPIKRLVQMLLEDSKNSVDPFSNGKKWASVTNELDENKKADFHMDALDFLKSRDAGEFDLVLFDPPYSPRQVSEVYKSLNKSVNMQTTQASFWSNIKKEIARVTSVNGKVLTCGWNSGGVGKKYGFEIEHILLVAHGGWHNDTISTVEIKTPDLFTTLKGGEA